MSPGSGYREHAHTADWELEAWAPDLPGLLEQAARGMYGLSGLHLKPGEPLQRALELHAHDAESLVVRFLSELLWFQQQEWLGFDDFSITVDDQLNLHAELRGRPIANLDKEIKAVTYHNLQVKHTGQGLQVTIVFDV